jgi:hypothetical protein
MNIYQLSVVCGMEVNGIGPLHVGFHHERCEQLISPRAKFGGYAEAIDV